MKTLVSVIDSKGDFPIKSVYSLPPEEALVAFFMQNCCDDYNTAEYPNEIPDMRKTKHGIMCDAYVAYHKLKGKVIPREKQDWILYATQLIA